jgi:hypothetical protein
LECVEDILELLKEQEHKDKMFHALEEDWKRLKNLLKEQEEERRNIVHWLGKFCAYLDFKDECWTYEENLAFFRKKMREQFGWDVADDED